MKRYLLITLIGFLGLAQSAWSQIGMNQWRIHFSAFKAKGITATSTNVYMACSNGIIRYDLEDNTVNQLTVTNGLSDLDISAIGGNEAVAVVGYVNGNLDVIE